MQTPDIPLPHLAAHLRAQYGDAPTYAEIYKAVLSGLIPAHQERGRWHLRGDDLPSIAQHFRLHRTAA